MKNDTDASMNLTKKPSLILINYKKCLFVRERR